MKTFSVRVKLPDVAPFRFRAAGFHVCDVLGEVIERFGLGVSVTVRAV
jgi:hypothetical protein